MSAGSTPSENEAPPRVLDATPDTCLPRLPEDAPEVLRYWRATRPGTIARLLRASACVAVGGFLLLVGALSVIWPLPAWLRASLALPGAPLFFYGLFSGFIAVPRILGDEDGLALRTDGVAVDQGKASRLFAWETLERVAVVDGRVVLRLRDDHAFVLPDQYGNESPSTLARILEQQRARHALGLRLTA